MSFKMAVLTLALILAVSVPGVYGVGVSVSSSNVDRSGSFALKIDAADDAAVQSNILVKGARIDPTIKIKGIGSLYEDHHVTDSAGNRAEIHARVISGLNPVYADALTPDEGDLGYSIGYVAATQSLTVGNSRYIMCSQSASNLAGGNARSSIEINRGELSDYSGTAAANTAGVAIALQSLDSASGKGIETEEAASNSLGSVRANTEVADGSIDNYHDSYAFAVPSMVWSSHNFNRASGWEINLKSAASQANGEKASARTEIAGTMNQDAYLADYSGSASLFYDFYATAGQTIGTASGKEVDTSVFSSYAKNYSSSAHLDIQYGSLNGYMDSAYSSQSIAASQQNILSNASGRGIELAGYASNADGSKAGASTEIEGTKARPGFIGMYTNSASATATTAGLGPVASVSQTGSSPGVVLSGKTITLKGYASDKSGDKVRVRSYIEDGVISGYETNSASANNATSDLSASQRAIDVSGKNIELYAKASAAKGLTVNNTARAIKPSHVAFHNIASVSSGVPSVDVGIS